MTRKGKVFFKGRMAGILEETAEGAYRFTYDPNYRLKSTTQPISLTLPLREQAYEDKTLFAFFDGLIPEGWLLDLASKNWKINPRDRMGILLSACRDCIGAVHIEPISEAEHEPL